MSNFGDFNDLFENMFGNFKFEETKDDITNKYIKGLINKDEFMKRMKEADKRNK